VFDYPERRRRPDARLVEGGVDVLLLPLSSELEYRHRMGHGLGLDVHERPVPLREEETPLEAGMAFTDEPSILPPDRQGVRIGDVVVCEEGGAGSLNADPRAVTAWPG
jgi:Xaa-Pro aminopeptidase